LGWGEGWEGSHSAADSHIFFLEIRREFGGHKNFVLHPNSTLRKVFPSPPIRETMLPLSALWKYFSADLT
jgi:hypothetical protein